VHLRRKYCIAKRWSQQRKEAIITSREQSAQLIYGLSKQSKTRSFISFYGIYGVQTGHAICTEDQKPANDFSFNINKNGRQLQFQKRYIRTVKG
jgi:NAD dependent epimerase/dehydratase family enzyme